MEYTTTIQQEKKVKKNTKFNIWDMVQYTNNYLDIYIFQIQSVYVSWEHISYSWNKISWYICEEDLTLVSKSK